MPNTEPSPCPFCGSEEIRVHEGSSFRWLYAYCNNCGAQAGEVRMQTLGNGTAKEWRAAAELDAMTEWNKRHNEICKDVPAAAGDASLLPRGNPDYGVGPLAPVRNPAAGWSAFAALETNAPGAGTPGAARSHS